MHKSRCLSGTLSMAVTTLKYINTSINNTSLSTICNYMKAKFWKYTFQGPPAYTYSLALHEGIKCNKIFQCEIIFWYFYFHTVWSFVYSALLALLTSDLDSLRSNLFWANLDQVKGGKVYTNYFGVHCFIALAIHLPTSYVYALASSPPSLFCLFLIWAN